jgi:hypothetical protein
MDNDNATANKDRLEQNYLSIIKRTENNSLASHERNAIRGQANYVWDKYEKGVYDDIEFAIALGRLEYRLTAIETVRALAIAKVWEEQLEIVRQEKAEKFHKRAEIRVANE